MHDPHSASWRYLAPLSQEAFDAIAKMPVTNGHDEEESVRESPHAAEFIVGAYRSALIYDNEKLKPVFQSDVTDARWRNDLTPGQRMLHAIGVFDDQMRHGGITQFFWNCPELIFDVSDAIRTLGPAKLSDQYDRALEGLVGKKAKWADLRKKLPQDPASSSGTNPFQRSYDMLDLGWFDDAYFNQVVSDDHGDNVLHDPGLGATMLTRLVAHVKAHREEFIE